MDGEDKPREVVIHQSANRPNLLLGGDRELVLITMMVAAGLAFSLATFWGIVLAIVYWIASMAVLQRMGKADPLLRKIYLRHIRYLPFYPAKSGILAASAETPRTWSSL
jgi:type IV secretion system protein VirB3